MFNPFENYQKDPRKEAQDKRIKEEQDKAIAQQKARDEDYDNMPVIYADDFDDRIIVYDLVAIMPDKVAKETGGRTIAQIKSVLARNIPGLRLSVIMYRCRFLIK